MLPPPRRTEADHRVNDAAHRDLLRFILRAKAVGLTLQEIGEILRLRSAGQQPCERVRALLDHTLAAVDRQLRALAAFRDELLTLREEAADNMAAEACVCGIIEHHEPRQWWVY